MRRITLLLLTAIFLVFPAQIRAEGVDSADIYQIQDVVVDVTAGNASQARDQAMGQAQRSAFEQLLSRLGTDTEIAARTSEDDLSAMVQALEVQQERTSAVRYIGTLTVQFKPSAVRNLLNKHGTSYTEARSTPVVVFPVVFYNGRQILWEEGTKWRTAWEEASRSSGLVPIVIPSGDLDDIALLSTSEAIAGNPDALQVMIKKYQTTGAIVAILKTDPDNPTPKKQLEIEVVKYDHRGKTSEPSRYSPSAPADANAVKSTLSQAVRQIRADLENGWKQNVKAVKGPSSHLPVIVPINSLAEWNHIKQKLGNIPAISKISVIVLTRGETKIELEFRGEISDLQSTLEQDGLFLEDSGPGGAWLIKDGEN